MADATYTLAVEVTTQGAAADLGALNKQIDASTAAIRNAGAAFKTGYSDVINSESPKITSNLNKVASAHAGVNRELLVITGEIAKGNYTRLGGSLLVLAEQTNALGGAFTVLAGLSAGALAGLTVLGVGVAATGLAFYQSAQETRQFNDALALTNNFVGLTQSQFAAVSDTLGNKTVVSFAKASEVVLDLAKAGHTTSDNLLSLGQVVIDFSKLTGENVDKVSTEFDKLNTKPAEFSAEINRSLHIFSPAQLELIKNLEDTGNKQQATTEALKVFTAYLNGPARQAVADANGFFSNLGTGLSDLFTIFKQFTGAQKLPFLDQIAEYDAKIKGLQDLNDNSPDILAAIKFLNDQKLAAYKKEAAEERKVTLDNFNAYQNAAGQAASDTINGFHLKATNQLQNDLTAYKKAVDTIRAQNPTDPRVQPAAVQSGIQQITKRDTAAPTEAERALKAVNEEVTKLGISYGKLQQQANASLNPQDQAFDALVVKLQETGKGFVTYEQAVAKAKTLQDGLNASIVAGNTITLRKDISNTDQNNNNQLEQLKAQEGVARQLVAYRQQLDKDSGSQFGIQTADQVVKIKKALDDAKISLEGIRDAKIGNAVTDNLKDLTEQSRLLDVQLQNFGKTNADYLNNEAEALSSLYKSIDPEGRGKNITDDQKAQLKVAVDQIEAQKQLIEQNKQISQSFADLGTAVEDWYLGSTDGIKKVRLELIKLLALEAFKASGESQNGLVGSLVSSFVTGLSGRAAGGYVKPGQTVVVGENRAELFTAGASGGYVTPNTNALKTPTKSQGVSYTINPQLIVYGSIVKQDELDQQFSDWATQIAKQVSSNTNQQITYRQKIR